MPEWQTSFVFILSLAFCLFLGVHDHWNGSQQPNALTDSHRYRINSSQAIDARCELVKEFCIFPFVCVCVYAHLNRIQLTNFDQETPKNEFSFCSPTTKAICNSIQHITAKHQLAYSYDRCLTRSRPLSLETQPVAGTIAVSLWVYECVYVWARFTHRWITSSPIQQCFISLIRRLIV